MLASVFRSATRSALPRMAMASSSSITPMYLRAAPRFVRFSSSNTLTKNSPVTQYASSDPVVKYTEEHEWIAVFPDNVAFIGITGYAADALGDATYVETLAAGDSAEAGDSIGSVESVKSASEIYAPVSCEILEGNTDLSEKPNLINEDPTGKAWIAKVKITEPEQLDELYTFEKYEEFLKSH
ncbi:uncharacterized protein SAPINGB_P002795 [Magnusiomyces paraingens]|uniref:Glycine cleavage system H protein n=1 Tax=Magnusiomyces paraingens TaxID=2606893 RepID=A0A5E8BFW5_9ASCO|nr:uncharacterized protein SAPINGB_P002795 [Saprochaete ingens]VVT50534.1 unnamed protein product [Saprochaete ingens]